MASWLLLVLAVLSASGPTAALGKSIPAPADALDVDNVYGPAPAGFLPYRTHDTRKESWGVSTLSLLLNATTEMYNHISVDVAYNGVLEEILTFPERRPRVFNLIIATSKTMLADLVVQFVEHSARSNTAPFVIDWWRGLAFALFGFFYEGLMNWFLYVTVFTQVCPMAIRFANSPFDAKLIDRAGQLQVLEQVMLDNFICTVMIYFPIFYIIKEAVYLSRPNGKLTCNTQEIHAERSLVSQTVRSALSKYMNNIKADNLASCAVWVPLDFVMFSLPMFLRMPFGHLISFCWTMLLSHMRGSAH